MPDIKPPIANQMLVRKWACYATTKFADDIFYLYEFIDICLCDMGEDNIVEMLKKEDGNNKTRLNKLGNNWDSFMHKYRRARELVSKAKVLYDKIEGKIFSKIENKDEINFLNFLQKIDIIQQDFYSLAFFLLSKSAIRGQTITAQDWKLVENIGLKKLEVTSRKPLLEVNSNESFSGGHSQ